MGNSFPTRRTRPFSTPLLKVGKHEASSTHIRFSGKRIHMEFVPALGFVFITGYTTGWALA